MAVLRAALAEIGADESAADRGDGLGGLVDVDGGELLLGHVEDVDRGGVGLDPPGDHDVVDAAEALCLSRRGRHHEHHRRQEGDIDAYKRHNQCLFHSLSP